MIYVSDLMTSRVFTLRRTDTLQDVRSLMQLAKIRHIPVTEDGDRFVGLLTHRISSAMRYHILRKSTGKSKKKSNPLFWSATSCKPTSGPLRPIPFSGKRRRSSTGTSTAVCPSSMGTTNSLASLPKQISCVWPSRCCTTPDLFITSNRWSPLHHRARFKEKKWVASFVIPSAMAL